MIYKQSSCFLFFALLINVLVLNAETDRNDLGSEFILPAVLTVLVSEGQLPLIESVEMNDRMISNVSYDCGDITTNLFMESVYYDWDGRKVVDFPRAESLECFEKKVEGSICIREKNYVVSMCLKGTDLKDIGKDVTFASYSVNMEALLTISSGAETRAGVLRLPCEKRFSVHGTQTKGKGLLVLSGEYRISLDFPGDSIALRSLVRYKGKPSGMIAYDGWEVLEFYIPEKRNDSVIFKQMPDTAFAEDL